MAQMSKAAAVGTAHEHWPSFLRSRQNAIVLDHWMRGEQYELGDDQGIDADNRAWGQPYKPSTDVTDEYVELGSKTPTPWAGLIVTSLAQTAYVDGVRRAGANENLAAWQTWQANRWDAKQTAIHRTAIGLSTAYGVALPSRNPLTGDKMTKMLARSPKRMAAFYDDDDDEWCMFAIEAMPQFNSLGIQDHWLVRLYDEHAVHFLQVKGTGRDIDDWTYISFESHPLPVPPVARCVNRVDLDGRATGEIEPVLPLLRRIDQTTFDRLIVQRFGAWKIRYIAGLAKPDSATEQRLQAMRLKVEDLLISTDHQTKFGTLDASDIEQFIKSGDADLRMLSAITQTPPHHLLGLSSNLQAEALAAAESGLQRKSADFRMNAGEFHEQMFRMTAMIEGRPEEASAVDMQVRWRDTESRSLTQAADAMGKLAVQLKVPVEMLWEKLPGWTDSDTERAKNLIENGSFEALLAELAASMDPNQQQGGQTGGQQQGGAPGGDTKQ